ncbi:hypothetical protein Fmac_003082 [Flemingia macrophylla]|uniref:Fe2OG dioxygenase domain-containing protein n=1 Tax=Flemingia macrophylla TaxID=520843 RepID=A0ABD1NN78_9FABA
MDSPMANLGNSLLVPSVHELAKQPLTKVPERYLRLNQQPVISDTKSLPQLPVIHMNKLLSGDEAELHNLNQACKHWGFFQLINHGVNPSLVQNVKMGVTEFFGLPMEEKNKLWQKQGELEGYGQNFVTSDEQKLEWADLFYIHTLPSYTRNPHVFANIPQPFRNDIESYSLELEKLCFTIIKLMTKALKIKPEDQFLKLFEDLSQSMRMNCYPPCPQPEHVIGLNPHSDAGALTILLQVNEMEGLQIKKDGMWIPIKPLSNAFVINVGDIMEILTNGIYESIEHRATINSEERISIATFHRPQMNKMIGPTPSLVSPERPAMFKNIVVADYYRQYFSRELQGKKCLDVIRTTKA